MSMSFVRYSCFLAAMLFLAGPLLAGDDITQADIDESGAVYNYLYWHCSLENNQYVLRHSGKVTIYNVRGEPYGNIVIAEHSSEKLEHVTIRVVDAAGKELFVRKKGNLERICGYGSYDVYKDICYYESSIDVAQFPFSVIFEYEKKGKALFLWPAATVQRGIPVENVSYFVEGRDRAPFRYRLTGLDRDSVPIATDTSFEWKLENIPAYTEPDYAAYGYGEPARLVFVPEKFKYGGSQFEGDSWADIARWYHELAKDKYSAPEAAISTREIEDTTAFIKEAYDEVRSSVRYVSVQIGIGGWQPYEATKTYGRKYGDCKDMSTLLISLLRSRGIEAYPVLVLTRNRRAMEGNFPSFGFNHVICCAIRGADTAWMDPTCNNCPFGEIGWQIEDIPVLVVSEDGGRMVHTPASRAEDNRLTIEADMAVTPDYLAGADLKITATGNRAIYLRGRLSGEKEEDIWTFLKVYIPGLSGPYEMQNLRLNHLYQADSIFTLVVGVRRIKPFRKIGHTVYVDAFPFFHAGGIEDVDLEDRDVPLQPLYPSVAGCTLHITLDPALTFDSVTFPAAVTERHSFGYVQSSISTDGSKITTHMEKGYNPVVIDVDQFDEFSKWCDALGSLRKQYIKINR